MACCFCGNAPAFHNPMPIAKGDCCDTCNHTVIMIRSLLLKLGINYNTIRVPLFNDFANEEQNATHP